MELRANVYNHRVAASDAVFRFSPVGNSGALFCYAAVIHGLRVKALIVPLKSGICTAAIKVHHDC